jgi:replicative DNA helicase
LEFTKCCNLLKNFDFNWILMGGCVDIQRVAFNEERRCLETLIFSKKCWDRLHATIDPIYFTKPQNKEIITWCKAYYDEYKDAPKEQIWDMLLQVKADRRDFYQEIIEPIIERNKDVKQNDDYLYNLLLDYFRKRELIITANNITELLTHGNIIGAESQIENYKKFKRAASNSFDPFDDSDEIFRVQEQGLFKFPGDLGEFLGEFQRGWFVALSGAFKIGKTFFLQEFFFHSILNRVRVGFFSLEMSRSALKERLYKRFLALADVPGLYRIPVFDCLKNQNRKCTQNPIRVGSGCLLVDGKRPPMSSSLGMKHKVCTACIGTDDFEPTTWYESINKDAWERNNVNDRINKYKKLYSHFCQMHCFPRFSASVNDIKNVIDSWHKNLNFFPDVIIIDYADILKASSKSVGFEKEDEVWMELARIASELNCMVVTATQITRAAMGEKKQKEEHISKWIGKLAHVDMWISLDQESEEKERHLVRLGILEHRHKNFNKEKECWVIQDIGIGQVNLASYYQKD